MAQLRSIKEKLSWPVLVFLAMYLAAAVVLIAVFLPAKQKSRGLLAQLSQLEQNEQQLVRLIEQRPRLELQLRDLQASLAETAKTIPTQYDLPIVLAALKDIGTYYDLQITTLEHVPLQVDQDSEKGAFPLTMQLAGGQAILAYLDHVQAVLPTLRITDLELGYVGDNLFRLQMRGELQVQLVKQAEAATHELTLPALALQSKNLPLACFGLPFELVGQYLNGQIKVLGIVNGSRQGTALLSQAGSPRWVKVGDRLGVAVVSDITASCVCLDVDGVHLKLTIGG